MSISQPSFETPGPFTLGGFRFRTSELGPREAAESENSFWIMKNPGLISGYNKFIDPIKPKTIVEIGVAGGGGAAFINEKYQPDKLVLIDLEDTTTPLFKEYLSNPRMANARFYTGIDQSNQEELGRIALQERLIDRGVDLVIDDASHLYKQTKLSFEYLFPCLREGGVFVIEDWGWAHWNNDFWQKSAFPGEIALSTLIMQAVMSSGSKPGRIAGIHIDSGLAIITRGPDEIPLSDPIENYYLNRGKIFPML